MCAAKKGFSYIKFYTYCRSVASSSSFLLCLFVYLGRNGMDGMEEEEKDAFLLLLLLFLLLPHFSHIHVTNTLSPASKAFLRGRSHFKTQFYLHNFLLLLCAEVDIFINVNHYGANALFSPFVGGML